MNLVLLIGSYLIASSLLMLEIILAHEEGNISRWVKMGKIDKVISILFFLGYYIGFFIVDHWGIKTWLKK